MTPKIEKNHQFYKYYCNLYITNVMLLQKIKETWDNKEEMVQKQREWQKKGVDSRLKNILLII